MGNNNFRKEISCRTHNEKYLNNFHAGYSKVTGTKIFQYATHLIQRPQTDTNTIGIYIRNHGQLQ